MAGTPSIQELGKARAYIDEIADRMLPPEKPSARRGAEQWEYHFASALSDMSKEGTADQARYLLDCCEEITIGLVLQELHNASELEREIGRPILPFRITLPSKN